jgi:superfamily II DNA or RNA helicase
MGVIAGAVPVMRGRMDVSVGARVRARGLHWDVTSLDRLGSQTLLQLRCVSGDMSGLEWKLLYPVDSVELEYDEIKTDQPGRLNAWRLLHIASLLDQIPTTNVLSATQPGRLEVEPYQLVPMLRALELPRPRLLLADGVGLGKTIQAGLIATELIARRRVHRIAVICPAGGLISQWEQEFRQRFGLSFVTVTDIAALTAERRRLEFGGNPFASLGHCLLSMDFAKQDTVLGELERVTWDLAIIDEAHHCVGNSMGREETQRRRLAEVIARQSDGLLLLTATPHDGYDHHFASLIELLDPSLVDGKGGLIGQTYRRHVIRRLKSHVRDPETGRSLFRNRHIRFVAIKEISDQVKAFHHALAALVIPRLGKPDALAFVSLLKRSVSTISACVSTLRNVLDRYERLSQGEPAALRRERARALRAYRRRGIQLGTLEPEVEADMARLEEEVLAADFFGASDARDALRTLVALGEDAARGDPKLAALKAEIYSIRTRYPQANILVYSEYVDSIEAVVQALATDEEILSITGASHSNDRARAIERFSSNDGLILLSTDSSAEGLNLHQHCFHLIHLDLPYNPNRLEQRNGRIDRYGQQRDPDICYLCLAETFEERVLIRLIYKYERARIHLDEMPDTLGVTASSETEVPLMRGFAERQKSLFAEPEPIIRTLDNAVDAVDSTLWRAVLREIDDAYDGFDRMAVKHGWMSDSGLGADAALLSTAVSALRDGEELHGMTSLCEMADCPIGRADPAVRQGIVRARYDSSDARVSMAHYHENAALFTYIAEMQSSNRVEWSRVLAVRVTATGKAMLVRNTRSWLDLTKEGIFHKPQFDWIHERRSDADEAVRKIAARLAMDVIRKTEQIAGAETAMLTAWLSIRTEEICGTALQITNDLFGMNPNPPKWRLQGNAIDRLAAFVSDASNPVTNRREAEKVLALFADRSERITARALMAKPVIRPLGILLLTP